MVDTKALEQEIPELAQAMMDYLGCECTFFAPSTDDAPILQALKEAKAQAQQGGYVPMLIAVDETLFDCLIMNSDEGNEDMYEFDKDSVASYRKQHLSLSLGNGKDTLNKMLDVSMAYAKEDDIDWDTEIVGTMEGGDESEDGDSFGGYWDYDDKRTLPLILAKIPVKHPWEVFAYVPFGNWNECPDTQVLMEVSKYWFEKYGAIPAVITHDVLEFDLPEAIAKDVAMEVALEQYVFCEDIVSQGTETVGALADTLWRSKHWYFWWDQSLCMHAVLLACMPV